MLPVTVMINPPHRTHYRRKLQVEVITLKQKTNVQITPAPLTDCYYYPYFVD